MAFDGITVSAVVHEMNARLVGGRLFKIAQPEPDELFITVKNNKSQYKLMISANASLPLVYFTDESKTCAAEIISDYIHSGKPKGEFTRGLFYRGVE